jgi:hypothetical protein
MGIELAGQPYERGGLLRPPADAIGVSAIRGLPNGASAVEFARGWTGVERLVRTLSAVGYVEPSSTQPSYAVLDVLDADGEIIADYDIPTAQAFRYLKKQLGLTVESTDGDRDA